MPRRRRPGSAVCGLQRTGGKGAVRPTVLSGLTENGQPRPGHEPHQVNEMGAFPDQRPAGVGRKAVPVTGLHKEGKAMLANGDHPQPSGTAGAKPGQQTLDRRHEAVFHGHPDPVLGTVGKAAQLPAMLGRRGRRLFHQHRLSGCQHRAGCRNACGSDWRSGRRRGHQPPAAPRALRTRRSPARPASSSVCQSRPTRHAGDAGRRNPAQAAGRCRQA